MNFGTAIAEYFKRYAEFKGRTSLAGFWWAFLFTSLVSVAVSSTNTIDPVTGMPQTSALASLVSLGLLVPNLAIGVRRLHDVNEKGTQMWWLALPIVGWIILLLKLIKPGMPAANEYGNPVK